MTVERLQRVAALARAGRAPLLNLTFHSSELMPGGSPYNRTGPSIESLYSRLDRFFAWVAASGMQGATLSEACDRIAPIRTEGEVRARAAAV